ncbi:hypothetical protein Taro_025899 [Colocasia esculenta]|uniref:CCHC-type domain-containing protein n=1 Tax=Colocasia esculenta TaxID=4460 RepID=A0A843VBF1_COLES|nr:hypothetical protein [Colocasia esculenta]
MAPRRRPREGVAEQATRQEVGDAPPPQQTQPLPQDAHSGIIPPPPPPQVAQGLDMTRFLEGMAQFVAQHRDAPVPQGGTGRVLREFLQFQPPQFLGQPDPDAARAWLDAVELTFRSMECVPEERVLLASYQLQAQALTMWSAEWETTFQSCPLRQIPWQEFVVSFERAFCPTYVRTERLYQFLDLQQRDSTVVQYRARFVELGRYAPQIMRDEGLRTQQFVRGLRPELRQTLIVARVTDLDAAYQTAAALEADTLRTRARSAEVQTQVVPSQPHQQQGSVQTTPRTTTSYASTSTGTTAKSGSRRKFRRDRRQAEQRQQSVGSVQQPTGQPSQQVQRTFAGQCYRCDQMGHMARDCPLLPRVPQQQTQSQPRVQQQQQQQAPVQQRQQTGGFGGSRGGGRVTHLTHADAEAAHLVEVYEDSCYNAYLMIRDADTVFPTDVTHYFTCSVCGFIN